MNTEESIGIIEQMITAAKEELSDDGFLYLLWGYLVLVASSLEFFLLGFEITDLHFMPWPILMTAGGIVSGIYIGRKNRQARVKTFTDNLMAYLWGGLFVCILLALFSLGAKNMWHIAYPVVMILYGIGTFVSGGVLKFRPLIFGGLVCWIGAAVSFHIEFYYQLPILAAVILLAYIIPGHILMTKFKRNV